MTYAKNTIKIIILLTFLFLKIKLFILLKIWSLIEMRLKDRQKIYRINWTVCVEVLTYWSYWYTEKRQRKKFEFENYNSFRKKGAVEILFTMFIFFVSLHNFSRQFLEWLDTFYTKENGKLIFSLFYARWLKG